MKRELKKFKGYYANDLPEVNHKNGIKTDNRVENLEWVTKSQNQLHRFNVLKKGVNGEKNPNHKLNCENVKEILKLKNEGKTHKFIANKFNISIPTISNIINGISWCSITGFERKRLYRRWTNT